MRLGLLGTTGHLHTYAPALATIPGLRLVAVAAAGPEENVEAFANAPGLTSETRRYDDARQMLEEARLDIVQICCRPDRIPHWTRACLERGVPVMAEKPLAMDLPTLTQLYETARATGVPLLPMHTQRGEAALAAVREAVQAGAIGEPLVGFSQKTYKWGATRPDFYRSRETFPGLMPFIGVHALDWLYWILGDVFTEVQGREGTAAHPDFPACASQGAYLFTMRNGGSVAVTLDYLRPASAPTHGDERLRIAGTRGVIETAFIEHRVTLITAEQGPQSLPLPTPPDIFTAFVRSLRGEGAPVMSLDDAFRITEIVLKAQQAADTGQTVSLLNSSFTQSGC
jgi:predicted dehydrogenase